MCVCIHYFFLLILFICKNDNPIKYFLQVLTVVYLQENSLIMVSKMLVYESAEKGSFLMRTVSYFINK